MSITRYKGVVCTNLFPLSSERTQKGSTVAVRELVEGLNHIGLDLKKVIRVNPLIGRAGFSIPRYTRSGLFDVYDSCLVGFSSIYSAKLTKYSLEKIMGNEYFDYALCHYARNVLFISKFCTEVKKRVWVVHNTDLAEKNFKLSEQAIEQSDLILARSFAIAHQFKFKFGLETDGVVFSGIDETLICKHDGNFNIRNKINIVTACSLIDIKNVDCVIKAISELKQVGIQATLQVYGSGPEHSNLKALTARLRIEDSVIFHGYCPRIEVLDAMKAANLFIMPSAPETMGVAYLEAMASGCVVIGHKGWGIDGIVRNGINGFLVDSASPNAIKDIVIHYLSLDRRSLHRKSLQTVSEYTHKESVLNYKAQLDHLFCGS